MSDPTEIAGRGPARPRPYQALLVALVLLGELASVQWPAIRRELGVDDFGMWFIDSYAILAASDTAQVGQDPYLVSPFDPLGRLHSYSRWWLVLGDWGLTRDDNFLFGGACVAAFLGLLLAWLRPGSGREAAWLAALCLSPPMLLLVNRANNDLVVGALLLVAFAWLRHATTSRLVLAIAALALATGLKFYPVAALAAFVVIRPTRRMRAAVLAGAVVCGAVFLTVRGDFARASFPDTHPIFTFGAAVALHELGWSERTAGLVALVVLGGTGWVLARRGATTGLDGEKTGPLDERLLFVAGACLLLGCFIARVSYSYRWVFALLLAPWLWRQAATGRAARVAIVLLTVAVWMDGFFCLIGNGLFGPFSRADALVWTRAWKFATQPLVWVLLALVAGWLWELLFSVWRRRQET